MADSKKKIVIRLIKLLSPYKVQVILAFFALFAAAGATLYLGVTFRRVIDQKFLLQDGRMLNRALFDILFIVCILSVASFIRSTLSAWIGEQLAKELRQKLFSKLLAFEPQFFDENRVGDLVSRIQSDTMIIRLLWGGSATTGLRSMVQFIGALGMLFWTSPYLATLTCLVIPLVILPIYFFGAQVKRLTQREQHQQGQIVTLCEEQLSAVTTLQSFQAVDRAIAQFNRLIEESVHTAHKRSLSKSLLASTVIALVFGSIAVILWYGGRHVIDGQMSAGELTAFIFFAALAAGSVNSLSEVFGHWMQGVGAAQRLFDILDKEPAITSTIYSHTSMPSFKGEISFQGVNFRYPTRHDAALYDISFTVQPGEMIAIVGPSGAGKTTLFKLLQRFYDVDEGAILMDGLSIQNRSLDELRQKIAWVPQDVTIFSGSIRENLQLASAHASDVELMEACQKANIDTFIQGLPQGLNTLLGERGIRLSGGQRQRLAIARAILKNADILLLDEATNALDAENERAVQTALAHLMKGRTTFVVAHRLSTVLNADQIIVLDHGRLIAQGNHHTLMQECSLYRRHAELQFQKSQAA